MHCGVHCGEHCAWWFQQVSGRVHCGFKAESSPVGVRPAPGLGVPVRGSDESINNCKASKDIRKQQPIASTAGNRETGTDKQTNKA